MITIYKIGIFHYASYVHHKWPGDNQHETEGEGGVSGEHQGVDLGGCGVHPNGAWDAFGMVFYIVL